MRIRCRAPGVRLVFDLWTDVRVLRLCGRREGKQDATQQRDGGKSSCERAKGERFHRDGFSAVFLRASMSCSACFMSIPAAER